MLTFWGFWRETVRRSFHFAFEAGHRTHALIILVAGAAFVLAGIHFNERYLIMVPFIFFVGAFFTGVFWFAYEIYREEYKRRVTLEAETSQMSRELFPLPPEAWTALEWYETLRPGEHQGTPPPHVSLWHHFLMQKGLVEIGMGVASFRLTGSGKLALHLRRQESQAANPPNP